MLSLAEWHFRYQQQARWTASVRRFLYQSAGVAGMQRILEVGCGTGVILQDLATQTPARLAGIDILSPVLRFARQNATPAALANADALALPFAPASFDACICHFFLLWVQEPLAALQEMKRVLRPGGVVLALAEPDYGGRIDYPADLAELAGFQSLSLVRQGADPLMGRKLKALFHRAGLKEISVGLLGGEWRTPPTQAEWQGEWKILENDLRADLPASRLAGLRERDQAAWQSGERILFVPTFYASGKVLTPQALSPARG